MWTLDHVGMILGTRFAYPAASVTITAIGQATDPAVQVINHGFGTTTVLDTAVNALGSVIGQSSHGGGRVAVSVGGYAGSLLPEAIAAARESGINGSVTAYLTNGDSHARAVELLAVTHGSVNYLYTAPVTGSGLSVYQVRSDGSLGWQSNLGDTSGTYARGIAAMAAVQVGSQSYVYTGSALESGITGYRVGAGGALSPVASLGVGQLIPTQTVSELRPVLFDGVNYLIAASSGSSSLTVFRVGTNGVLTAVDHLIDSLETRFDDVAVLDVIKAYGRVFVLAGGADDGLSLMTMLPGGRLVHVLSIADSTSTALTNVSGLEMLRVGNEIQVFTTSGGEAGLSLFRIDLSGIGAISSTTGATLNGTSGDDILTLRGGNGVISAGGGDDILSDGGGIDHLWGGGGADIFVMAADGGVDLIRDFQLGLDRLDLSQWTGLRSPDQLWMRSLTGGGELRFGAEQLRIYTADGRSLTRADLVTMGIGGPSRVIVSPGVPVDPVPPPDPDPDLHRPPPAPPPTSGGGAGGLRGTEGADVLRGTSVGESFYGLGGDDLLIGGRGRDRFWGGAGHDTVSYEAEISAIVIDQSAPTRNRGGVVDDTFDSIEGFIGTRFNDQLYGTTGANWLSGGGGNDFIDGRGGNDRLVGGAGNDSLLGRAGDDVLSGDSGNDNIAGANGNDLIYGGSGDDAIGGGNGNDRLYGGNGNDVIGSGNEVDLIDAGDGDDVASGGWGNDTVIGGYGNDTLAGSYGNDRVYGGVGHDDLGGGWGHDRIYGGAGNDRVGAGENDDWIYGGVGADFLGGSSGNDQIWGERGDDTINGGSGNDVMRGGNGADTFVFNELNAGEVDTILHFENGLDRLRISGVAGDGQAGRFDALAISTVHVGGVDMVQLRYAGHVIRISDITRGDLDPGDFVFL